VLNLLLGPALELGKDLIKGKADEKKAIQERKIAAIQNDANWEAKMADATANSWKDEFWTIVLASPVIAVMYGAVIGDQSIMDRVNQAFAALDTLPEWFTYCLFISISASYGLKSADKLMNLKKGGK
jgi:hypothetical protein